MKYADKLKRFSSLLILSSLSLALYSFAIISYLSIFLTCAPCLLSIHVYHVFLILTKSYVSFFSELTQLKMKDWCYDKKKPKERDDFYWSHHNNYHMLLFNYEIVYQQTIVGLMGNEISHLISDRSNFWQWLWICESPMILI